MSSCHLAPSVGSQTGSPMFQWAEPFSPIKSAICRTTFSSNYSSGSLWMHLDELPNLATGIFPPSSRQNCSSSLKLDGFSWQIAFFKSFTVIGWAVLMLLHASYRPPLYACDVFVPGLAFSLVTENFNFF